MSILHNYTDVRPVSAETGATMIEVLVSLIILMVGLLGLAGLMVQSQRSEMESYQRVQALILLQDMVGRINANRNVAANLTSCYGFTTAATGTPYLGTGTGTTVSSCSVAGSVTASQIARANADKTAWSALLQGAAETSGGTNAGAMVGARGCVSYNSAGTPAAGGPLLDTNGVQIAGTGVYTVEVVWQGTSDTFARTDLLCATGLYGAETRRRVVSLSFRIASINNLL